MASRFFVGRNLNKFSGGFIRLLFKDSNTDPDDTKFLSYKSTFYSFLDH